MSQSRRILVVDDSPGDARLITEFLGGSAIGPHTIVGAPTLAEGVEAVRRGRFDVVLLDLGLPDSQGGDGVEKMWLAAPTTPIIVLSGTRDEAMVMDCLASGAEDYLWKGDLEESQLRRAVGCALARRGRRAEVATPDTEAGARTVRTPMTGRPLDDRDYLELALAAVDSTPALIRLAERLAAERIGVAKLRQLHEAAVRTESSVRDLLADVTEALMEVYRLGPGAADEAIRANRR